MAHGLHILVSNPIQKYNVERNAKGKSHRTRPTLLGCVEEVG